MRTFANTSALSNMIIEFPISRIESKGNASRSLPAPVPRDAGNAIDPNDNDARRILAAAVAILDQGIDLVRALSRESYTSRVPYAFNGSIGGHYRHCLDHFISLLRSLDSDMVDYDDRERDHRIETDTRFALSLSESLRAQLQEIRPSLLDSPVKARCEVSYAHGDSPVTASTFGRELVYAIAHAIHHFALISIMARLLEIKLPEHFGVAPSTLAHQGKQEVGK
jgi:hypothetical protein